MSDQSSHRLRVHNRAMVFRLFRVPLWLMGSVVFLACVSIRISRAGQAAGTAKPSGAESHGVDLTSLDKTCKP